MRPRKLDCIPGSTMDESLYHRSPAEIPDSTSLEQP